MIAPRPSMAAGMRRVGQAVQQNPLQFTPLSMRQAALPTATALGEQLGVPQLGADVGSLLRGALAVTPFGGLGTGRLMNDTTQNTPRGMMLENIAQGLTGAVALSPLSGGLAAVPKVVGTSTAFGGTLGAAAQAASNIAKGQPVEAGIPQAAARGAEFGVKTAPTSMLTGSLVGAAAKKIPGLGALTDESVRKTIPKAGSSLADWMTKVGQTGAKRILRAALLETPIEGVVYGLQNQTGDKKLIDSIAEEAYQNLIFNIGFAASQTASDSLGPLIRKSVSDALDSYQKMAPAEKQAGFINLSPSQTNPVYHIAEKPGVVYRAEDSVVGKGVLGEGTYVARTPEAVKRYGKDIMTYEIAPKARLMDLTDPQALERFTQEAIREQGISFVSNSKNFGQDKAIGKALREYGVKLGFDGIMADDNVYGTVLFDRRNLIPSRQGGYVGIPGADEPTSYLRPNEPEIGFGSGEMEKVARERFNIPELKRLGGGSDRDVFDLGDKVLKVAKTARGLDQNSMADWLAGQWGITPELLEKGKNYVVYEKVDPPDANTKKMLKELGDISGYDLNSSRDAGHWEAVTKFREVLEKYNPDLANMFSYGDELMYGDLQAKRNWGTKDGLPVLVDEGSLNSDILNRARGKTKIQEGFYTREKTNNLADPEFREIHGASRQAKKKFGDMDRYTMYGLAGGLGLAGSLIPEPRDKKRK